PQEAYQYYPGYSPGPPACYTHAPPDATYQPCPCPMQSCPKNVHTGPLTGESKGPGPATTEGSSNGGSNGLSFSPPPASASAVTSATPTASTAATVPPQMQLSPPAPVALLLLEPHAGNTAGKIPHHPPSPARGSAGGMPPLAPSAGTPTPSSTDTAETAITDPSSVSSAGSAVAAAVSVIADEKFDGTSHADQIIDLLVPNVPRVPEDCAPDAREQCPAAEESPSIVPDNIQQQSCEEMTVTQEQQCMLESKKHFEAWAVSDIHKIEAGDCIKSPYNQYEKEEMITLMKTGKEAMKENGLDEVSKNLITINPYQKTFCNPLLYGDTLSMKQGSKILDTCDLLREVPEKELKGEVKSEDESFKEEKDVEMMTDQVQFHQKGPIAEYDSSRKRRLSNHDRLDNISSKKMREDVVSPVVEDFQSSVEMKLIPPKKASPGEKRPADGCPTILLPKKVKNGFKYQHTNECEVNGSNCCTIENSLKTTEPSVVSECGAQVQQTPNAGLVADKGSQPLPPVPKTVPNDCQFQVVEEAQTNCRLNNTRLNGAKDHAVQDVLAVPLNMLPPSTSQPSKPKKTPTRRRRNCSAESKKTCKASTVDSSPSVDELPITEFPQPSCRTNGIIGKGRHNPQTVPARRHSSSATSRGSKKGAKKVSILRSLSESPPLPSSLAAEREPEAVEEAKLKKVTDINVATENGLKTSQNETELSEPVSMPPPVTVSKKSKKTGVVPHCKTSKAVNKPGKSADYVLGCCASVDQSVTLEAISLLNKVPKKLLSPKWSNGWTWEGKYYYSKIFLTSDDNPVVRKCYPSMRHVEGDLICARDCVLLKSGTRKVDLPFVAKVAALWENPEDGEMMVSLLWYYRPEHTEHGRKKEDMEDEIFASKHKDTNSVACIEDKCYVLTFNEYCRYRKEVRRIEEALPLPPLVVPEISSSQGPNESCSNLSNGQGAPRRKRHPPPSHVSPDMVFFCRRVYDFRQKRILKNPG
ncbi:hypothetical protein J437_LFUL008665, partial [Ladona fulva]